MKLNLLSRISRFFAAFAVVAVLAASLPQPVYAASVPTLTILSVKADENVRVRGENFPRNIEFTVRMDAFGNRAIGGTIVAYTNSGDGSFEATYAIPNSLRGVRNIAIRMDGASGWFSFNWFVNRTTGDVVAPVTPVREGRHFIEIVGVERNETVTVQANRFPANQTFRVRVGPFVGFFRHAVQVGTIHSGAGGTFTFSVALPAVVKDVEMITIRLDSAQGFFAFNAFRNIDTGTVVIVTPPPSRNILGEVVATTNLSRTLRPREDFDAIWTVRNVSSRTWDINSVDYKFVSGAEMQKFAKIFDFKQTVKPGETVRIVVDMLAPDRAGTYTTNWAIVQSGAILVNLPLTVVVH